MDSSNRNAGLGEDKHKFIVLARHISVYQLNDLARPELGGRATFSEESGNDGEEDEAG